MLCPMLPTAFKEHTKGGQSKENNSIAFACHLLVGECIRCNIFNSPRTDASIATDDFKKHTSASEVSPISSLKNVVVENRLENADLFRSGTN